MKKKRVLGTVLASMLVLGAVGGTASAVNVEVEPIESDSGYVYYEWQHWRFYSYDSEDESVLQAWTEFNYDADLVVPETVNGKVVDRVNFYNGLPDSKTITIPASVKVIEVGENEKGYSYYNYQIPNVYYEGTREQWENITLVIAPAWSGKLGEKELAIMPGAVEFVFSSWEFETSATEYLFGDSTVYFSDGTSAKASEIVDAAEDNDNTTGNETDTDDKPETDEKPATDKDNPATPGDSDTEDVLNVTLANLDSEKGLEGEALEKALFGDSGLTWSDVEKIEFTSDDLFSVSYKGKGDDGWVTLGDAAAVRAAADGIWNTAWTLNTADMAKDGQSAKIIAKDGVIDVTAKIYLKNGAENPSEDNPSTGIALAIAPVVLAAGFAVVALKKRK